MLSGFYGIVKLNKWDTAMDGASINGHPEGLKEITGVEW